MCQTGYLYFSCDFERTREKNRSYIQETGGPGYHPEAHLLLGLLLYFAERHHASIAAELLVVAIGDIFRDVEVLHQGEADVHVHRHVPRQPDFIVHSSLFDHDARALVNSRQEEAEGNRVNGLGVEFDPLALGLVDPDAKTELG